MPSKKTEDTKKESEKLTKLYLKYHPSAIASHMGWSERTVWARLAFHGITGSIKRSYCTHCGHSTGATRRTKS